MKQAIFTSCKPGEGLERGIRPTDSCGLRRIVDRPVERPQVSNGLQIAGQVESISRAYRGTDTPRMDAISNG